jgi:hypothetical protein
MMAAIKTIRSYSRAKPINGLSTYTNGALGRMMPEYALNGMIWKGFEYPFMATCLTEKGLQRYYTPGTTSQALSCLSSESISA